MPVNPLHRTMSLHIESHHEVAERLRRQRRNTALSSLAISLLAAVLLAIVLALILIPGMQGPAPELVAHIRPPETTVCTLPTPKPTFRPKPTAPSQPVARVLAAQTTAPMALEVPEVSLDLAALGSAVDDFGDGWHGTDHGESIGGGGGFGSGNAASGGIRGHLYDFKQKPDGETIAYNLADRSEFVDRVARLQRSRFSESSLSRYFRAPNSLYLTHLAIALSPASEGPAYFGAKDSIKPSGWIARYSGTLTIPKTGTYRFSGMGDDYLIVMLDGRVRLVACWPDIQESVAGRWKPTEPTGKHTSPFSGVRLVYGDWVRLNAGQRVEFDLVLGERPGGKVGFILQIEEKGGDYRKAADGRPILPLFTTTPIGDEEISRLRSTFGSYEIEWEQVPVFPAR